MSKLKQIVAGLIFLSLWGCYEVSEKDLFENYQAKIVIESEISNLAPPYYVYISYSAHPNDSVNSYPISDAEIILSDNMGNSDLMEKMKPGVYRAQNMEGVPLLEYSLRVKVGEEVFEADDKMENPAQIFKTEINYLDEFVPESGNYIKLFVEKIQNETRYYKLEVTENDSLYNSYTDIIVFDDAFFKDTIEYLVPYAFHIQDTVQIALHVISADMYRYYYQLNKQTNNTFRSLQPPMKNPLSNINTRVLGYFQVSAITQIDFIIE